jgi:hypothetical protein
MKNFNFYTDLMIMDQKFLIFFNKYNNKLILIKSFTGEVYGQITVSHMKKLLKNNK